MRTIATLNLPASTSGIWRFAPPCVPVAAQAAPPPLAPAEPAGALLVQAPNMSTAAAAMGSNLSRLVAIVPPPPSAREPQAGSRRDVPRSALGCDRARMGPTGSRSGRPRAKHSRHGPAGGGQRE